MSVTIDPTPCGRRMHNAWGKYAWTCGGEDGTGALRCRQCETLGSLLADALHSYCEFSNAWADTLAANLCVAALLCSAANLAVWRERAALATERRLAEESDS